MKKIITNICLVITTITTLLSTSAFASNVITSSNIQKKTAAILTKNPDLNENAVKYALKGYIYANDHNKIHNFKYITIVNCNEPDTKKRLHVINLNNDKIVLNAHVSQGRGSGDGVMATHFSNAFNSDASSLGTYVTGAIYYGHHGRSEHIIGIEKGINNSAASCTVEIHQAWYVNSHHAGQ